MLSGRFSSMRMNGLSRQAIGLAPDPAGKEDYQEYGSGAGGRRQLNVQNGSPMSSD